MRGPDFAYVLVDLGGRLSWPAPLTSVAYFVLAGTSQKSYLFTNVRELIFGSGWKDWLTWIVAGLLLVVVLYLFGWLWMWIGGCVLAVALAAGFHYSIDSRIASRRSEPLEKVQRMLRSMRLKGLEEDSLRQFVCKYSGERWEEFYEALFGYEAKLAARDRWPHGDRVRRVPSTAPGATRSCAGSKPGRWRGARPKSRRHLQAVEEKGLKAAGVDAAQANKQAEEAASKMLTQAKTKRSGLARTLVVAPIKGPLELVFGAQVRFIVGAARWSAARCGSSRTSARRNSNRPPRRCRRCRGEAVRPAGQGGRQLIVQ